MAESRLERIAAAIADGQAVDWEQETSAAAAAEKPVLQQLRVVAEIGAAAQGPGPGDRWGPLELVAPIGSGAFGDVFRAHDGRLGRDVALKLLREPDAGARVVAEGRMLAQVRHPGVATVHGADRIDGRTGIWMELVDGKTLEELLREQGPFDATAAARVGAELCSALAAVHAAGLVHRDVKAQNVMREPGGRVVLMDFGVGRPHAGQAAGPAGTPLYMAPELLFGDKATPRSDLYSLGVLLYHLVTGGYPYRAASLEALTRAHAAGERTLLRDARPDLPEAFVRVIERALLPEPGRRFTGAGEMEQALRGTVRPEGSRRVSWPWIAAPILIVGVALLYPWGHDHSLDSPPPTSTTLPPSTSPAPSPSATARAGRPVNDPFVRPVGGTASGGTAAPAADAAYSIEARLDGVQLRVRPSAAVSLYVFLLDDAERPSLIFPPRGRMADNPLVPGIESRVPLWGQRLVAVAAPARLADFEAELARQRVPVADSTSLPLSDAALERLADALGFAPRAAGRFLAGAKPVSSHVELLRGVWVRRLR